MTTQEKLAAKVILAKAGIATSKTKNLALGLPQKFGEKFAGEAGGVLGKEADQWLVALFSPELPVQYA